MHKLLLLLPAAVAGLFFSGCVDDPYYGRVAYDGPGYYGGPDYGPGPGYGPGYGPDYGPAYYGPGYAYGPDYGPDVDFYYVGGRPYSHLYGALVFRDNQYFYSHGGALVTYDRGRAGYRRGAYADRGRPGYRPGAVQQQTRNGQVVTRGPNGQVVNGKAVQQKQKKDENER